MIAVITIIKGILALAATVVVAYALATAPWSDSAFTAQRKVLAKHRYSLVPLLILAIVAVTPGADILDQVLDIERRWADGWENFFFEGGPALLALVLLAGQLFLIGRARAHHSPVQT